MFLVNLATLYKFLVIHKIVLGILLINDALLIDIPTFINLAFLANLSANAPFPPKGNAAILTPIDVHLYVSNFELLMPSSRLEVFCEESSIERYR